MPTGCNQPKGSNCIILVWKDIDKEKSNPYYKPLQGKTSLPPKQSTLLVSLLPALKTKSHLLGECELERKSKKKKRKLNDNIYCLNGDSDGDVEVYHNLP